MNKILFCGSYIPNELIRRLQYSSQAGNNFQMELINGLSTSNEVDILSYIGYPIESSDAKRLSSHLNQIQIYHVIKSNYKMRIYSFWKYLNLLKKLLVGKHAVLLYNYNYINWLVPHLATKLGIKSILIVADHSEPEEYANPIRKMFALKSAQDFNKFDGLIFLSEKLRNRYLHCNTMLLEGGICLESYKNFSPRARCEKLRILYSGLLNNVTGVDLLLKAINLISAQDIEFIITGRGDLSNSIAEMQENDARIKLLGFLPQEKYYELLNEVDVVINPRNMVLPQNQNNFPSKILEYLASGRVIISTRFPGFNKFRDSIFFCDSTPNDIARMINFTNGKYDGIYERQFQLNRKLALQYEWSMQAKKIDDFFSRII